MTPTPLQALHEKYELIVQFDASGVAAVAFVDTAVDRRIRSERIGRFLDEAKSKNILSDADICNLRHWEKMERL
jgi:hypothetical protein